MASAASSDWLLSCPWGAVKIGESKFLCKSWFGQTQYNILLLDQDCLWEEQLQEAELQARAQELNRRLRASTESFFSHLVTVVTPCLTGKGRGQADISMTIQQRNSHMTLRLKSELAGLPFYWEFHCRPAPVATACVHLVRPLLVMSGALQRQTRRLFELLWRKDAEIQDFRENGAQLSRERLQTEPFDEDSFRQDFMTTTFPLLLDQNSLDFDSELQDLFSIVTSQQQQQQCSNKRKQPDQAMPTEEVIPTKEATPTEDSTSTTHKGEEEADSTESTKDKNTSLTTMQKSVSYPSAADRAAPKAKKKKTGLFR